MFRYASAPTRCVPLDTPTFCLLLADTIFLLSMSFCTCSGYLAFGGWKHARNARLDGVDRIAIGYRFAVEVLRHCICSSRLPNTTQLRLSIDPITTNPLKSFRLTHDRD
jgi:hypothetical protein